MWFVVFAYLFGGLVVMFCFLRWIGFRIAVFGVWLWLLFVSVLGACCCLIEFRIARLLIVYFGLLIIILCVLLLD